MIRVLNIVCGLNCGGLETSIMNFYRHMDRSAVQFDFLFTTDETRNAEKHYYENEAVSLGANIYRRPTRGMHPIQSIRTLARIVKENPQIRAVHIHSTNSVKAFLDCILALFTGVPVRIVYSSDDIRTEYTLSHLLFRPMLRMAATHWFAGSYEAGMSMFGKTYSDKFALLPRARDLDAYRYNPQRRHIVRLKMGLSDKYVIISVGRLTAQKNPVFLIEAFASAIKEYPEMVLLFAGDGELRLRLESLVVQHNLHNSVRFLGVRDDVSDLLQAADLFVMPSLHEGLPGAAIEAQAAGLPCLLSDTISGEINVTGCVEFLPIDEGVEIWARRILAYRDFEHCDTAEQMRKAGYDICDAAKRLQEFYINASKNKKARYEA